MFVAYNGKRRERGLHSKKGVRVKHSDVAGNRLPHVIEDYYENGTVEKWGGSKNGGGHGTTGAQKSLRAIAEHNRNTGERRAPC